MAPDAAAVRARLARLRADPAAAPCVDRFRERVRDVVVIGSSSRGGSSILAEILRRTPQLLHFRAEVNPFFVLHDRAWPASGARSDALDATHAVELDALSAELAWDCGTAEDTLPDVASEDRFAVDLAARLTLQWPAIDVSLSAVRAALADTLAHLRANEGWAPGDFPDAQVFHAGFLARLRRVYPAINPYYYDLDRALVARFDPGAPLPSGPPSGWLVEEPPFVCAVPWRRASAESLTTRPLLVKTPSNAYRLPFLQALFPNAHVRVLHLTRNVAASVNGLYDGWRFPGFFSHAVDRPLAIRGYSDLFPEWGDRWWKFDLPPGWEAVTDRGLAEVCAFQWRSAHGHLLDWLDADPARRGAALRLRFEDVVGPRPRQDDVYAALTRWLGVTLDAPLAAVLAGGLPPVMATETPRRRRWFERAELLSPILADPASLSLMERLGYAPDPQSWT